MTKALVWGRYNDNKGLTLSGTIQIHSKLWLAAGGDRMKTRAFKGEGAGLQLAQLYLTLIVYSTEQSNILGTKIWEIKAIRMEIKAIQIYITLFQR